MAIDFMDNLKQPPAFVVPICSTATGRDILVPFARAMGLEWLPDIVDRAGLYIDATNKKAVLDELSQLKLHLSTSTRDSSPRNPWSRRKSEVVDEIANKLIKAISEHLVHPDSKAYVG